MYVAFDLLARGRGVAARAARSPSAAPRSSALLARASGFAAGAPVELMPTAETAAEAERWLAHAEGAIAKERSAPYRPGERKGMVKVKRVRTIDAVVVGWRPGKEPGTVGALILGLYDGGELRVVGHCSGLTAAEKRRLVGFLAPVRDGRARLRRPEPLERRPASSSGSPCAPSWSSRSTSTTSPRGASATARSCGAGARTRTRAECTFEQLRGLSARGSIVRA